MTQIVLTSEQHDQLVSASGPIALCRPDGRVAAYIPPHSRFLTPKEPLFTPEEIAEAERRANEPGRWYTTQEVLEHLRSLEQKEAEQKPQDQK